MSVPSYTRVGSYPGWKRMAISIADAAASTSATPAIAQRARPPRNSFPPVSTWAPGPSRRTRRRFIIHPASSTIASTIHGQIR